MNFTDPQSLKAAMAQGPAPAILDVRLEDDFAAAHVPGAKNNCVYEVAFDGRMPGIFPDKFAPLVIAGSRKGSCESAMAAEKLERLGYADVRILDGGLSGWTDAGGVIEGTGAVSAEPVVRDGRYEIDREASCIRWRGRNVLNSHHGTIAFKSGRITMEHGLPVSGEFVIDMNSIRCDDLAGDKLHDVLIAHLCSHDFFDTAYHPEAKVEIVRTEPVAGACCGRPNVRFYTALTLRGRTAPLMIDAATGVTADGKLVAQCALSFDRTLWKVIYGSSRFFHRLAGHLVNDFIEIDLKVVTT